MSRYSPGRRAQGELFDASGTFTVPPGVELVYVTFGGAGGGGGGGAATLYRGGFGGAGEILFRIPYIVTPGDAITVTIGAGGVGGALGANDGADGGDTTFGDIKVRGGMGGTAASPGAYSGTNGLPGNLYSNGYSLYGEGGDSGDEDGTGYCTGGGAGINADGGDGADGFALIEWEG